jgi:hypothetical protein
MKFTSFAFLLYLFDDDICFCGHTGPTSQKYQEVFLSRLLSCVTSSQPEVRQAAAYGCGVLGQFGGPGYAQGSKARPTHCQGFGSVSILDPDSISNRAVDPDLYSDPGGKNDPQKKEEKNLEFS